jgi:hypothetical protein
MKLIFFIIADLVLAAEIIFLFLTASFESAEIYIILFSVAKKSHQK